MEADLEALEAEAEEETEALRKPNMKAEADPKANFTVSTSLHKSNNILKHQ